MTGTQVLQGANKFGVTISDDVGLVWVNLAQREISSEFPLVKTSTVANVVIGTTLTIATGIIDILSAVYEEGDYPLDNISVVDNVMTFGLAATSLTVVYKTHPADLAALSQPLTVHTSFHPFVMYYLLSMYWEVEAEGDSEESSLARDYYQKWVFYKSKTIESLGNTQISTQNDPVVPEDCLPRSSRKAWGDSYYEDDV